MPEREAELTTMIEKLVWSMHLWACDEDGIHPDAYATFREALLVAAVPHTMCNDDGEPRYRFTHDWAQRMRETVKLG